MDLQYPEARIINDVVIIGPDLFALGDDAKPASPIASVFPKHRAIVTGRGIHALQAEIMLDFLRCTCSQTVTHEMEEEIFQEVVSLLIRPPVVLIRSDPCDMEKVFSADELLQRLLPKECIEFTGLQLAEVRKKLRRRGESWRISPPPHSPEEIEHYIESSQVRVNTGTTYYFNASTGGRFLTYQEFMNIRPLLETDKDEALARLEEIFQLTQMVNNLSVRELSFFLPADKTLDLSDLKILIDILTVVSSELDAKTAEYLFDRFANRFAAVAGPELLVDSVSQPAWRTTMFCRLYDINEKEVEEWTLGLSPEFHLNVRWLPGVRICGELLYESQADTRIRQLTMHYWQIQPGMVSINFGRVESSQANRDRSGEQREVYLVVLGLADGCEDIRLIRMIKWDVMHRLKTGKPLHWAIAETIQYRDYILDRLRAAAELKIPNLPYSEIRLEEEIPALGKIPVFFFDRQYVQGIVSDKIPTGRYAQPGFMVKLGEMLGIAAAASLILGRACPRSGHVFFDDGDEVIVLNAEGLPDRLIIADITGSFTDWTTPVNELLPHCLWHLARHLERARSGGISSSELRAAMDAFAGHLCAEIERMQFILNQPDSPLRSLFSDRSTEPGGIRYRWEAILHRLSTTVIQDLHAIIAFSNHLATFL